MRLTRHLSSAARTLCSDFIKVKAVPSKGRTNEVFGASQSFGGSLGVPNIASIKGERSNMSALRIDYEVMERMQADVDTRGLQECCTAYPDQCTKRYISPPRARRRRPSLRRPPDGGGESRTG